MNARKCVHAQKPYPSQAFAHESNNVGRRKKEKKRDGKDRGQEADGKKSSPTKQNTSEELKQGLPALWTNTPLLLQRESRKKYRNNKRDRRKVWPPTQGTEKSMHPI